MISSIGSSSQEILLQMLQQRGDPQSMSGDFEMPDSSEMEAKFESVADKLGIDATTFAGLQDEIHAAVQDAMSSSDGSGDMRSVVDAAINGVLEANGIDPAEFKATMEEMGVPSGPPPMGGPPPAGGMGGMQGTGDASEENDLMAQLLESLGSDGSSSGETSGLDIMQWLQNLPVGSLADCYA